MTTDIRELEAGVWTVTPLTPVEQIADMLGKLEYMQRKVKELRDDLEARMVEKIVEGGADIVIGETRYYVGNPKKVKCRDAAKTLTALLEVAGGDLGRVAECLASGAFKYGTVRVLFEDDGRNGLFDELFETTTEPELREGKPVKRLQKVNTAFLPG